MATTAARQLLKGLCDNSEWNYAVLWKLRLHNELIMTWEDGYFDFEKQKRPEETVLGGTCLPDFSKIIPIQFENGASSGYPLEFPVVQLAMNMMDLQYTIGKGIVGQVACSGSPYWVLRDDLYTSYGIFECPDELILQFASGIKTILLVPVLPHGVVQLGSLETVAEDQVLLSFIKNSFTLHHDHDADNIMLSSPEQIEPILHFHEALRLADDHPNTLQDVTTDSTSLAGFVEALSPNFQSTNVNDMEIIDHSPTEMSCIEDMHAESLMFERLSYNYFGGLVDEDSEKQKEWDMDCEIQSPFLGFPSDCGPHTAQPPTSNSVASNCLWDSWEGFANPSPTSGLNVFDDLENLWLANEDRAESLLEAVVDNTRNKSSHKAYGSNSHMSPFLSGQITPLWHPQIEYAELDGVVSSNVFAESPSPEEGESSALELSTSTPAWTLKGAAVHESNVEWNDQPKDEQEVSDVGKGGAGISNNKKAKPRDRQLSQAQTKERCESILGDTERDAFPSNSISFASLIPEKRKFGTLEFGTSSSSESLNDTTVQKSMVEQNKQPKKAQKLPDGGKRKAEIRNGKRARPRDRQLIQDRIEELRELIPHGTECSIDGLLEQTIKHMVHLKGVREQADKLKRWEDQEVLHNETLRSAEVGSGMQSVNCGSENDFQLCPIVVQDLPTPGHMVIEMPCGEAGLFIEIAQAMRRLDLTILKGTTKNRANDTWASFIVEAKKGFQKLEVFWPLMQIWQKKRIAAPMKFSNSIAAK